jgi:hypothetical protein
MNDVKKRSTVEEKFVETLVVADKSMAKQFENEELEYYLLTIMNMVSYHLIIQNM